MASRPDDRARERRYFLPYQERYLDDQARLKIVEKSRRIGFTYVQSYEDVRDACRADGGMDVWFSSADKSAAEEYIRYCERWVKLFDAAARLLGEVVLDSENDVKALVIELSNGHRINAMTSNPRRFRSKGGKVVLDEYAFHDDQRAMWKAASPAITWGYPMRVLSTHNGRSCMYYQRVEEARKPGSRWHLHTITLEDAVAAGLVDKIKGRPATDAERQDFIAECRDIAGDEESFLEEYMCVARDSALAWLPWELITSCESDLAGRPELYAGGDCYVGVDIGRRKDLFLIWVDEEVGDVAWCREIVALKNASFAAQDAELDRILQTYRVRRLCMDQTGMGEKPVEDAQRRYGQFVVEGVVFNGAVKQTLAQLVKEAFEDQRTRIPAAREVRESHHAVRRVMTAAGNPRFDADRNDLIGHADHFWAHSLARHARVAVPRQVIEYESVQRRRFNQPGAF